MPVEPPTAGSHAEEAIVRRLQRHARGLLVALAALALTAGVVMAARTVPPEDPAGAAADGLNRASEVSGKTLPAAPAPGPQADEGTEEAAPELTEETDEAEEAAPEAEDGDRPENHGWFVSEAAKAETPAGFDNHGQYVSSVAKGDAGKPDTAGGPETTDAKSSKGAAKAAEKAADKGKGKGNH
jgi:hypothetical protein